MSLQETVNELQRKCNELDRERDKVSAQLDEAIKQLLKEKVKDIAEKIPYYVEKLERLKRFVEGFMAGGRGHRTRYAFRKVAAYSDDDYEPIHDPLDWRINEYELLGMDHTLEIVFDVSNDAVEDFVKTWMKKNMFWAEHVYEDCCLFRYPKTSDSKQASGY